MFAGGGGEEAAEGLDGVATFADDAREVGLAGGDTEDVASVFGVRMGNDQFVGVFDELAQNVSQEFLHFSKLRVER